jgi:hypothetical protein
MHAKFIANIVLCVIVDGGYGILQRTFVKSFYDPDVVISHVLHPLSPLLGTKLIVGELGNIPFHTMEESRWEESCSYQIEIAMWGIHEFKKELRCPFFLCVAVILMIESTPRPEPFRADGVKRMWFDHCQLT